VLYFSSKNSLILWLNYILKIQFTGTEKSPQHTCLICNNIANSLNV
jgi:hypothetical protein